jgi:hypothetical protein
MHIDWQSLVKAQRLDGTEVTQFSLSARVASNTEKSAQSRMFLAVERAVIAYVATAEKDAGHNIHGVFSRYYMQLDYTPNGSNAMPLAVYMICQSKKSVATLNS